MLNAVIRFALTHRPLVLALSVVVLVYGGYLSTTLPIDVFPDLDRPRVVIMTECPGLSPEEIESQVTYPLETAMLGAAGVQAIRSQANMGMSIVYVDFDWDTEIRTARQVVTERLALVTLPADVRPVMMPPASLMAQILHIGLQKQSGPGGGTLAAVPETAWMAERIDTGVMPLLRIWQPTPRNKPELWTPIAVDNVEWLPGDDPRVASFTRNGTRFSVQFRSVADERRELRSRADWLVRPRLLGVPGVAEVIVIGGDRKQYQVLVDPLKLQEYGVALQEVDAALQASNLNASGGYLETGLTERSIRVIGRLNPDPERVLAELRMIPVKHTPERVVLLSHVAEVNVGSAPKRGDASVNGQPGVILTLTKQPHADTRRLTEEAKAIVKEIEATLPADMVVNIELFQLKSFIDRGIYYVEEALLLGAGLVVIVLLFFLVNVRTTLITLTAIPLSLVITTLVFRLLSIFTGTELTINVMTLGGIAVAMGELVDDAIVDVENIYRRLAENRSLPTPQPAIVVVYQASREIRSAIVFGTAVVVLAFVPLFALSGIEGRLFVPLGVAYIVSILASLLVSLTVTPVLSYYLLANTRTTAEHRDGGLLRALKWGASFLIRFSMRRAPLLLLITWIAFAYSAWKLSQLGADFLPKFDEGSVQLNVSLPGGSSLQASNEVSALIDARLRQRLLTSANPAGAVLHFMRRTGRAELDEHVEPVSHGEYILIMNPEVPTRRDEFLKELLADLRENVPGVGIEAEQPMSHLISHMLSGVNAQIAIKIYGDDLDRLRELAQRVQTVIQDVPGATMPIIDPQQRIDEVHIVLRPDELSYYGLTREYVANFVQSALKGETVTTILDGQRRYDLILKLNEPYRSDVFNLGSLRLMLPNNRGEIRLRDVADFPEFASGPNLISRENARRRQTVRCNVEGQNVAGTAQEIERRVREQIRLPEGYFVEFGGQFQAQRSATRVIALLAAVSLLGILIVLLMLFPSLRITLQILNAVPIAFIGGVLALVLTKQTLTVASLVGFVSLSGIAVRNGILLVTHYFHLMRHEGESFTPGMILRGSLERLAPVLMTALTAGVALLPIVLGGQKPGLEILYPVATVILGGLVTSTFCEFLIHPGLFWHFSGGDTHRLAGESITDAELLRNVAPVRGAETVILTPQGD